MVVVRSGWLAATVLSGIALVSPVHAEEPSPASISAEQFMARVGQSHPNLELLAAAVDESAANVRIAGLWPNPALSYDREEIFVGGHGWFENYLRFELPLDVSGRRGLRVRGAELGLEAARAGSARSRTALLFDAQSIYWRAAAARGAVDLLQRERDGLGGIVAALRSRARAGDASGYDLDRLELEAESLSDLVAEAERELDGWRLRLGLLLGQAGARVDASDALALPAKPPPMTELLPKVLAARGDYQAARLRVTQAERELAAARRGWVPGVVLSGGAKNARFENQTGWGYVAGIALSVPVFDHGQGDAARAQARQRQALAEQRLIEAQATTEVVTAHGALTRAVEQAKRFEQTQLPRLDRLVRRAEVSYREGERPIFELLDAHRTARMIRVRHLELLQKARQAEIELARAAGQSPGGAK